MPEMGESVTEGTVLEWHVAEGDAVEEGETVVEVSTDKVDAEVPAPASGTITKILVGADERSRSAQPLAEMQAGEALRATRRRRTAKRRVRRGPGGADADGDGDAGRRPSPAASPPAGVDLAASRAPAPAAR